MTTLRSIVCVLVSIGLLAPAFAQTNAWPARIISKIEHPHGFFFLNPHRGDVSVLIVDGRRFEHVRGMAPFYLALPNWNEIVFVVVERDYSYTYHVFKMATDKDIAIHASHSAFGETIGFSNCCDAVQQDTDGKVILSTVDNQARSTISE